MHSRPVRGLGSLAGLAIWVPLPEDGVIGGSVELPIMRCMDGDIRDRVEALRREIAELQKLNLAYLQRPRPGFTEMNDHARREQRLKEIMAELKSMTEWKTP